ncbi:hypothetical protein BDF22DRAFT_678722 [Syncephalis plumigaleata]|nr:hypothetical protein BDF22DRAFT_678722 [Syncephalis plumigaleata]
MQIRNRRLQFALLAVVILVILTVHLATRETTVHSKQASQLALDDPTPTRPSIPSNHPLYSNKSIDATQNGIANNGGDNTQNQAPTTTDNSDHASNYYSDYRDSDRRQLLRQRFLGLSDSVEPCMHANGDIMYKFAVQVPQQRPTQSKRLAAFRDYQSESIEYGDILELKADDKWNGQIELFRWVKSLKERRRLVTFDYLMYMDAYTVVRLGMYRVELASGGVANQMLSSEQRTRLYLRAEHTRVPDLAILSANTSDLMVKFMLTLNDTSSEDLFSHFYEHYSDSSEIHSILDKRIYYWQNSIDYLPKDAMGVSNVFITEDYQLLQQKYPSHPPITCRRIQNVFNVAIVTSAHIFDNNCMLDAAYAIKHGYTFVARSAEYAQQNRHKHRGPGWGRLDVIQKVLPRYDWIFGLIWTRLSKEKNINFSDKHLVLTKLPGNQGVDPGVMLVRNSAWSHDFIQNVQIRREYYDRDDGVPRAISTVMNEGNWMQKILLLNSTDHSLLASSQDYKTGDFIVHYTDTTCPAARVLKATKQLESGQAVNPFTPL